MSHRVAPALKRKINLFAMMVKVVKAPATNKIAALTKSMKGEL